jgi:hypothetical protein
MFSTNELIFSQSAGSIGKWCHDARRLQAHWELENTGELDFLQILSPDNVQAACKWDYPAARVASSSPGKCKDGTAEMGKITVQKFFKRRYRSGLWAQLVSGGIDWVVKS